MKRFLSLVLLLSIIPPALMLTACSANTPAHELHLAAASTLPMEMQTARDEVRQAYQFAVANPDALKNVPCFCGCDKLGHKNNYDCYIQDAPNNGQIIFDSHALGCDICVQITQGVMQMTREGRSPPQIQRAIINQFTPFGHSNFPK